MSTKLNLGSLVPFIEEAFNRGTTFKVPVTGTSMNPLLYEKRDYVFIKKAEAPLEIGDIPLYKRADGHYVLHRVVGKDEKGYVMCGDNQFILEYGITDKDIIGVVCSMLIDGKAVEITDEQYIKHKEKYVNNITKRYPLRRMRYKIGELFR